jgi:hypothetical protein
MLQEAADDRLFSTYKRLRGQTYEVLDVGGPDRAADLILEGPDEYERQGQSG